MSEEKTEFCVFNKVTVPQKTFGPYDQRPERRQNKDTIVEDDNAMA